MELTSSLTNSLTNASENNDRNQMQIKCKFRQFLLTGAGFLWGICCGANFGLSSIIFAQLQDGPNLMNLTPEQESWIAALTTIAMIPATLCVGWLLEKFGRRSVAGLIEIVNVLAWTITYFSTSYASLSAGRLLAGVCNGMGYATYSTYIGEVTSPKYRASCITLPMVGGAVGVLLIQFMGNYLHWNTVALVFVILPFCNLVVLFHIRESYVWFINRNNISRACETFKWYKGTSDSAEDEFDKAIADITQKQSYSLLGIFNLLKNRTFLIPFAITNVSYMTSDFSGIHSVTFYASIILGMITANSNYRYYANLALNAARLLGAMANSLLIKKVSVRKVVLVCTLLQGIFALNLALFLYLSTRYPENGIFEIVNLLSLLLVVLLYAIGLAPSATVICGELYPAAIRGIGFSMSATMNALYLTVLAKVSPNMFDSIGVDKTFLIFGCITLVGITVLCYLMPNTKDKTLKDIENMFRRRE